MADKIVEQEEPGRFGFGTEPAVNAMLKRISSKKIQSPVLVAINIDTLVRNTVQPDLKVHEIVDRVCSYMSNITNDVAQIVETWNCPRHYIIFYHADAEKVVPQLFRRVHGGPTGLLFNEALKGVLERVKNSKTQSRGNVTSMVCLANELKQPSYKGLAMLFSKLVDKSVPVNMISHCPIDWHIFRMGRIGVMYRSYTGVVVELNAIKLGEIVFEEKGIPFYPITHVLLGDKSFIKGILVKKDKQNFKELCIRERFTLRSESYISTSSKINRDLIPYRLD